MITKKIKTEQSTNYNDLEKKACANNTPVYAHLELTYACNLKCIHCFTVSNSSKKELSNVEVKLILDQLADLGTLYMSLTGGEIFVRNDFFDIADYARKKGFALRLFTNGTLISPEIARKIYDISPLLVEISLYGMTPEIHEAVTKVPGSLSRTIDAIKQLTKLGIRVLIKTSVMKINLSEVKLIEKFAADMGAEFKSDPVISPMFNGAPDPVKFRINDKDLLWYFKNVNGEWKINKLNPDVPLCNAGKGVMAINPYGEVFPCVRIPIKAGDLRKQSLDEIWNKSAVMQEIRELTLSKLKHCAACDDIIYCNPCPGLALTEHGDILLPAEECCRQAKMRKAAII